MECTKEGVGPSVVSTGDESMQLSHECVEDGSGGRVLKEGGIKEIAAFDDGLGVFGFHKIIKAIGRAEVLWFGRVWIDDIDKFK